MVVGFITTYAISAYCKIWVRVRVMVFSATFNNISDISWSVLLVDETEVPEENHCSATNQ
jgi:hypothetical protein